MKLKIRFLMLILSLFSVNAFSEGRETTALKPLDDYRSEYKERYDAIFDMVESRTELNFREKQARYEQEVKALKREFKVQRAKDYAVAGTGSVTKTIEHSCRGRSASGGQRIMPVDCGYQCVEQPKERMFTKEEWVTASGDYSDLIVSQTKACIELRNDDTSLKKATLTATFKYNDSNIDLKIAEEAEALFSQ